MQASADPPMVVRSSVRGGFVRVNRSFRDRSGYTAEELATKPLEEWIVEEDRGVLRAAIAGGAPSCRIRHLVRGGGTLELALSLRETGGELHVLGRVQDPSSEDTESEDSTAESTVKGTLRRIALIVEEQNPGYKCSILLVAHGRFVSGAGPSLPDDYNRAIDGFAIGPAVGSCGTAIYWNVPVIVEDIQNDPLWVPFAALAAKAGVAACWSHPFSTKQGRVLGALALYSPEPRAPTPAQLRTLRVAAQMTGLAVERGRAEEALRSANAVKDRFLANLSHEVRTPLNALVGAVDYLENDPCSQGIPLQEVGMIREAAGQMLELFVGALELTEVQDRHGVEGRSVDLPGLLQRVCASLAEAAARKRLRFELNSDDLPPWVDLDEWSLERVLKCTIQNAVKFTAEGSVTVEAGYETDALVVRISDTGCGIDLDRLSDLRAPFVQGDLSTTKEYPGFGLGLALVDRCLEVLAGEVEYAAGDPRGTVVTIRVPLRVVSPPVEVQRPEVPAGGSQTVLVVEDNALNAKVIERLLDRSGYRCEVVENGLQAVQAVSARPYRCVLMDCQMPVMDGYEATRRIRERERQTGEHVPIIAVTANALAEDRDRCLEAGMDAYMRKPVRREELVSTLEEYIGAPVPA